MTNDPALLHWAGNLKNTNVVNPAGENPGKIEEIGGSRWASLAWPSGMQRPHRIRCLLGQKHGSVPCERAAATCSPFG